MIENYFLILLRLAQELLICKIAWIVAEAERWRYCSALEGIMIIIKRRGLKRDLSSSEKSYR